MKTNHRILLVTVSAASVFYVGQCAEYSLKEPVPSSPGYINGLLRKNNPDAIRWNVGGNYRIRYEVHENGNLPPLSGRDFSDAPGVDNDNDYLLQRVRARVGYTSDWFEGFVEGRSSSSSGDDRNPNPESDGPVDLHQAYIGLGNMKEFPLTLKLGRQELSYGDERLVGAFAWNNIGRVFDAVKLKTESAWGAVEVFTGRLVLPDDNAFNVSNDYDYFSGVHATIKKVPRVMLDLYFFARNASHDAARAQPTSLVPLPSSRDIYTFGLRSKSNPADWGNWDFTTELMGQFGRFYDTRLVTTGVDPSLDHGAYAAFAGIGHTWKSTPTTPRVGLEYNFSTGDSDPLDGNHETFENLFPTNHKFYGFMDFLSLQNIHDVRLVSSLKPVARINVALEGHMFWLASTSDSFYNVGGNPRGGILSTGGAGYGINPDYSPFVGSELDLVLTYTVSSRISVEAMFGRFFRGDYVSQSLSRGGSADANFAYIQTVFQF